MTIPYFDTIHMMNALHLCVFKYTDLYFGRILYVSPNRVKFMFKSLKKLNSERIFRRKLIWFLAHRFQNNWRLRESIIFLNNPENSLGTNSALVLQGFYETQKLKTSKFLKLGLILRIKNLKGISKTSNFFKFQKI